MLLTMKNCYIYLVLSVMFFTSSASFAEVYVDANGYILDTNTKSNTQGGLINKQSAPKPYIDENGFIVTPGAPQNKVEQPKSYVDEKGYIVTPGVTPAKIEKTSVSEPTAYLPSLPPQGFPDVSTTPVYSETINDASKNPPARKITQTPTPTFVRKQQPSTVINPEEQKQMLACQNSLKMMVNKRSELQSNLSVLIESINSNRWLTDRTLMSKIGYWSELKNLYQWVDIFNVKFRNQNYIDCVNAANSMIAFLDFANGSNISIMNAIIHTNEREFKIQTDTKCNLNNTCKSVYYNDFQNYLISTTQNNKSIETELSTNLRQFMEIVRSND